MRLAPQELRTFFVTTVTANHTQILQSERMARLLLHVLQDHRKNGRFLLHEFVIMPDHLHLLITPAHDVSLEKAVQYIKGGFSFRARKDLQFTRLIWQDSFTNHRIKDLTDYQRHRVYIRQNPVTRHLVEKPEVFVYSSAYPGTDLDPAPPWLTLAS